MKPPILSICIPTYNRPKELYECLQSIIFSHSLEHDEVELIVSDNSSSNAAELVVNEFKIKYKNIFYFKNVENIGGENNFRLAILRATGKYAWLMGDDDKIADNGLNDILTILKKNDHSLMIVNFSIFSKDFSKRIKKYYLGSQDIRFKNHNEVMSKFGGFIGLISCHIIKRELFVKIDEQEYKKFNDYGFSFLYSIYLCIYNKESVVYYSKPVVLNRAENSIIPDWPKFFITGLACVCDALEEKGYTRVSVNNAKNKLIIKMIVPYLIFRKKTTGVIEDVKYCTAEHYKECWSYWICFYPLTFIPSFIFQMIRRFFRVIFFKSKLPFVELK